MIKRRREKRREKEKATTTKEKKECECIYFFFSFIKATIFAVYLKENKLVGWHLRYEKKQYK
jgi:hypothetical protein